MCDVARLELQILTWAHANEFSQRLRPLGNGDIQLLTIPWQNCVKSRLQLRYLCRTRFEYGTFCGAKAPSSENKGQRLLCGAHCSSSSLWCEEMTAAFQYLYSLQSKIHLSGMRKFLELQTIPLNKLMLNLNYILLNKALNCNDTIRSCFCQWKHATVAVKHNRTRKAHKLWD